MKVNPKIIYKYAIMKGLKSGRFFIRGPIKDKRNLRKYEHGIIELTHREAMRFKHYIRLDNKWQYKLRVAYATSA